MSKSKIVQIDRRHSQAICTEIGERLRYMPSELDSMPCYLSELTEDLFRVEPDGAPPIAPTDVK